jgi:Fe2+ transport system protein FeoA
MTLFGRKHFRRRKRRCQGQGRHFNCEEAHTLADVPTGCKARVCGFNAQMSGKRRAHLQAYGLVPGYWVRVCQHSPVTIVQVEHTELALENELARQVEVES